MKTKVIPTLVILGAVYFMVGAKVGIGDVDPAGSETVETIKSEGGEAGFVTTDVRDEDDARFVDPARVTQL